VYGVNFERLMAQMHLDADRAGLHVKFELNIETAFSYYAIIMCCWSTWFVVRLFGWCCTLWRRHDS
jgi:hypothetical protein